jgi:hypothetical protein
MNSQLGGYRIIRHLLLNILFILNANCVEYAHLFSFYINLRILEHLRTSVTINSLKLSLVISKNITRNQMTSGILLFSENKLHWFRIKQFQIVKRISPLIHSISQFRWPCGLRPRSLGCWDRGFEFRSVMDLCRCVSMLCCPGSPEALAKS